MRVRAPGHILPLTVDDLTLQVQGERLLGPMSLTIEPGKALALIGPNGAGKSLFLRLCHGLIAPSAGRLNWQMPGGAIAGTKRHAMVFQKPVMLRRSASANLVHACRAAGQGAEDAKRRAERVLKHFGLTALSARPARLLSGGEQQRLAIARAAALEPQVLFLDEPTSQLDPGATRQIEDMLRQLKAEGITLIFATHDLAQARRLADEVAFFNRGHLVEMASALDFFVAPQSQEARAFIAGELLW